MGYAEMALRETSLHFFITPREPQRLHYSRPPDESWATSSLQDECLELSAERRVSFPPHARASILRPRDNDHFEGPGSSPSYGVESNYDLAQCFPATSASPNPYLGALCQFSECSIWVQSGNVHASQYNETIQSAAMGQLTKCNVGCGNPLLHGEAPRPRR
jgi:hypothetical protein